MLSKLIEMNCLKGFAAAGLCLMASAAFALDGQVGIHDPSTIGVSNGKYFAYGTGGNGIMSDDGWTWRGGAIRPNGGVAPDVMKVGDRYLVTYGGASSMWTKSLDPESPDFGFSQPIPLVRADGSEFNPIDTSLLIGPDGKLWMTVGSYVGYIRLYELDPKTGGLLDGKYTNIAIDCEASEMIFHDGWYYLFGNKASCCAGASSGYNIRVGRAKSPQGPFVDNVGLDMLQGAGKHFAASTGRWIGPGHFGLLEEAEGVQKWSCHYEADLDRGGASVLDIRPLYYKDGWPVAGFNILKETTFKIDGAGGASLPGEAANKQWTISPVPNVGGYPGSPFLRITVPGSNKALAINASKQLVTVDFSGSPEQLWRLDQLIDGSWRIVPRTLSDLKDTMALTVANGATTLAKYDFKNSGQHWTLGETGDPKVLAEGTYKIESIRSGRALEIAVEGVPVGGARGGRGAPPRGGAPGTTPAGPAGRGPGALAPQSADDFAFAARAGGPAAGAAPDGRGGAGARGGRGGGGFGLGRGGGAPIPDQDAAQVSANWPAGNIDVRLANYMCQAQQKWTVQPVAGSPGYYKIVVAGTQRALAATSSLDVMTVPTNSGAPEQLWKFDRLESGGWKITPKSITGVPEEVVLSNVGTGGVTLNKFDPRSDKQHWNVIAP